jgi:hypothetical protein
LNDRQKQDLNKKKEIINCSSDEESGGDDYQLNFKNDFDDKELEVYR